MEAGRMEERNYGNCSLYEYLLTDSYFLSAHALAIPSEEYYAMTRD